MPSVLLELTALIIRVSVLLNPAINSHARRNGNTL
jgi:hypothetical protein